MTTETVLQARIAAFEAEMALIELEEIKGGAGSGNWGHAGRKGKRGGSAPKKGPTGGGYNPAMSSYSGPTAKKRQALARVKGEPGSFGAAKSGYPDPVPVDGYLYGNGTIGVYYDKDYAEWHVIHTQSGVSLGTRSKNPLSAMEAAKEIEKSGIDFSTDVGTMMVNPKNMEKLLKIRDKAIEADKSRDSEGPDALGLPSKPKAPPKPAKIVKQATGTEAGGKAPTSKDLPPGNDKMVNFLSDGVTMASYRYGDRDPDKRLGRMLDASEDSRKNAKIDIMNKLSEKSQLNTDVTRSMVSTWANTSADSDIDALKMQESAAKILGREPSDYVKKKLAGKYMGTPDYTDDERERFLRAMYEHTQDQFAKAGLKPTDTVRVYRGVTDIPELQGAKHGDEVNITQNPMTSWSLSRNLARGFSSGSLQSGSGILTMDVPVSAIMGSCRSGFGCLSEAEVVIGDVGKHRAIIEDKYDPSVLGGS